MVDDEGLEQVHEEMRACAIATTHAHTHTHTYARTCTHTQLDPRTPHSYKLADMWQMKPQHKLVAFSPHCHVSPMESARTDPRHCRVLGPLHTL